MFGWFRSSASRAPAVRPRATTRPSSTQGWIARDKRLLAPFNTHHTKKPVEPGTPSRGRNAVGVAGNTAYLVTVGPFLGAYKGFRTAHRGTQWLREFKAFYEMNKEEELKLRAGLREEMEGIPEKLEKARSRLQETDTHDAAKLSATKAKLRDIDFDLELARQRLDILLSKSQSKSEARLQEPSAAPEPPREPAQTSTAVEIEACRTRIKELRSERDRVNVKAERYAAADRRIRRVDALAERLEELDYWFYKRTKGHGTDPGPLHHMYVQHKVIKHVSRDEHLRKVAAERYAGTYILQRDPKLCDDGSSPSQEAGRAGYRGRRT